MRQGRAAVAMAAISCWIAASAAPALAEGPPAPVVFFDIAAPSLASQASFYHDVFGWEIGPGGGFSVPVASPLSGNLRVEPSKDSSITERVIYIGVPDINGAMAKIVARGGVIVFPRMAIPGAVIVAMFKDPAGNRMGLVEMANGKPIVPPAH